MWTSFSNAVEPINFDGSFVFQNKFDVLLEKRIIELKGEQLTEEKINELTEKGYTCSARKPNQVICDQTLKGTKTEEILNRVEELYSGFEVKIYHRVSKPEVIFRTQFHILWQIEQKIRFGQKIFNPIFLSWTMQDWKYQGDSSHILKIEEPDVISKSEFIDFNEGDLFKRYYVKIFFYRTTDE